MHGFILSKLLQGLADTLYTMTRNIDPGQLRIKLQKFFHDLGCHPFVIIRIPYIHDLDSRKAFFNLCRKSFLPADQTRIGNLSGNYGNLPVSACHLPHQACCRTTGLKGILSHKA